MQCINKLYLFCVSRELFTDLTAGAATVRIILPG